MHTRDIFDIEMCPRIWTLLWLVALDSCGALDWCNTTIGTPPSSQKFNVTAKRIPDSHIGQSYYCWFVLQADRGQYVEVDVQMLNAGEYDVTSNRCVDGYIRVSEHLAPHSVDATTWMAPLTVCGNSVSRVKRYTVTSSAFVEFRVDEAQAENGFELDALFLDKEPDESLPYGHIQRTNGHINNTNCDWLIPADTCFGGCELISPGYPGVYPPNTSCRYTIINFEDGRVQASFGGLHGKFDLKESENCEEDYLAVYDGATVSSPLIGKYCGHDFEEIVSMGTTLLLEFHSANGGPPWDYSGFQIEIVDRWKNEHENGVRSERCDWSFSSKYSQNGEPHTPDHVVYPDTTCVYRFIAKSGESTRIKIKAYNLLPDCQEYLEVFQGDEQLDRLCSDRIASRIKGSRFTYEVHSANVTVKYHSDVLRISNVRPTWMRYTFFNRTEPRTESPIPTKGNEDAIDADRSGLEGNVNETGCDWVITVDDCRGICKLLSPNFTQQSSNECRYTLKNFQNERVQIQFGADREKFKPHKRCTDIFMRVFDGENAESPLVNNYCGSDSDFIVSSGSALHIEFYRPPGTSNSNNTIMEIQYTDRWENAHRYGEKDTHSVCNWAFNSDSSTDGFLNTPDHMIDPQTTCSYRFVGDPDEIVEIRLKAHGLRSNCEEFLEVYDGEELLETICEGQLERGARWTTFLYNSSGNAMTVKYHSRTRRVSNSQPSWIYYQFYENDHDIGDLYAEVLDGAATRNSLAWMTILLLLLNSIFTVVNTL